MLPSTSLRVYVFTLLLAILLLHAHPAGQSADHSILFTSDQHDVKLRDGTALTLRTVNPGHPVVQHGVVPPGQLVQATLPRTLDGRKAKVGDPVELQVVYPFHFNLAQRSVRVPPKASIHGRITGVSERADRHGEAHLAVALDTLEFGDESFALDAVVVTLQAAQSGSPLPPPDGFLERSAESPTNTARLKQHVARYSGTPGLH